MTARELIKDRCVNSQDSNTVPSDNAVETCSVTRCYAFVVESASCTNPRKFPSKCYPTWGYSESGTLFN